MTATVYPLKYPVQLVDAKGEPVGEQITELKLHRFKGKDLRALDNAHGDMSKTLALLAVSARLPPSTVDQLDGEDITAAGAIVADFVGGSQPTGSK